MTIKDKLNLNLMKKIRNKRRLNMLIFKKILYNIGIVMAIFVGLRVQYNFKIKDYFDCIVFLILFILIIIYSVLNFKK